jgi:hypothetical protein
MFLVAMLGMGDLVRGEAAADFDDCEVERPNTRS